MCDTDKHCRKGHKHPQNPEDCTAEQVSNCHGDVDTHPCQKNGDSKDCCCDR